MKQWIFKYKWLWVMLLNTAPFALDIALYPEGLPADITLFPPVFLLLTMLNYHVFEKTWHYVLMQTHMLLCMACSGITSTYLYYHNISSDPMTPAIGLFAVLLGAGIIIITTGISALIKKRKNKRKTTD